jgi:hypothetical protein
MNEKYWICTDGTLHRPYTSKQFVELQLVDVGSPVSRIWQDNSPTSAFCLFEQHSRLPLSVVYIDGTYNKGREVKHDEGELGVDVVVKVVLPCV